MDPLGTAASEVGHIIEGINKITDQTQLLALNTTLEAASAGNLLRYEYEGSHSDSDSHPNTLANQTVGPIFAQFLMASALA